jgi:hypothetical protein
VKDRLAARKQQRNLFAPVRSGVLGNEGPTFLSNFKAISGPRASPLSCHLRRVEERRAGRGNGGKEAGVDRIVYFIEK